MEQFDKETLENMQYIQNHLPYETRLDQLAEECAELIQAAHKVNRTLDSRNPTTVSPQKARDNLLEEIADVFLVVSVLGFEKQDMSIIHETIRHKAKRWVGRLQKREESNNA